MSPSIVLSAPYDRTDAFLAAVQAAAPAHDSSACLLNTLGPGCESCWCTCHPASAEGCDEGCGA